MNPIGENTDDLLGVNIEFFEDRIEETEADSKQKKIQKSNVPTSNSSGFNYDNSSINSKKESVGPQSFIAHKVLGKGSFGEVYLVEKLSTKTLYAMKVLSKAKIMSQNLVKYALTERKVLSSVNHPFIVRLHFAFQSSSKLFMVLEYCPGGDLGEYLQREKKFTEDRARIYVAEMLLALEYLHKKDIIYRDLKPDNVVLDSQGHALLTDFGLSKEGVSDNQCAKSFCGSMAYLAPEMMKRSGHGKSVDWYLLGVLLYEMIVGVPPYYSSNKYYSIY
jgi:serine/threonine protein kinase